VLRTNTKIAALQVVLRYRNLLAVEDAFKTAKALLATRRIFHETDAGIRGHVFCTFLALVLRKELFDRLAARHSRLEWQRIVDDLADLSEIEIEQDGRQALLRTAPGPTRARRRRQRGGRLRQTRSLREESRAVALSDPSRASHNTGQTAKSSVTRDFGCRYAERKRYPMTSFRQMEAYRRDAAKAHSGPGVFSPQLAPSQLHCWLKSVFCETKPINRQSSARRLRSDAATVD
jgi:hypothetical protein